MYEAGFWIGQVVGVVVWLALAALAVAVAGRTRLEVRRARRRRRHARSLARIGELEAQLGIGPAVADGGAPEVQRFGPSGLRASVDLYDADTGRLIAAAGERIEARRPGRGPAIMHELRARQHELDELLAAARRAERHGRPAGRARQQQIRRLGSEISDLLGLLAEGVDDERHG